MYRLIVSPVIQCEEFEMTRSSSTWEKLRLASFAGWLMLLLVLLGAVGGTPSSASFGNGATTDVAQTALKSDVATVSASTKLARLFEPRSGNGPDECAATEEPVQVQEGATSEGSSFGYRLLGCAAKFERAQSRAPPLN